MMSVRDKLAAALHGAFDLCVFSFVAVDNTGRALVADESEHGALRYRH